MMKLKSIALLMVAMLTLGLANVNAQKTDKAILNIKLSKVQSIIVTGSKTVDLEYSTEEHYGSTGISKDMDDHLQVFSTGGFKITAKAEGTKLVSVAAGNGMDVSDVYLTATNGTGNDAGANLISEVQLNNSGVELVSSDKGGSKLMYNVKYATKHAANAYVGLYSDSESPTVYTTTITYTIAPN